MKATELMIGDWVNLSDVKDKIIPCKIVELHTDELLEIQPNDKACDIVGYDMIFPLPLTPKILEKNGFTEDENCGYCVWLDKHLIAVNLGTQNLAIESILIADEVQIADNYIHMQALPIHYVYELQHALRLCGLNELADNFKI